MKMSIPATPDVARVVDRATGGDPDAQCELGARLITGRGLDPCPSHAVEWLGRAAAQGHVEALERLKQLAEHNPEAQYRLGEIYFAGDGVPTNIDVAVNWLKRAAAQLDRASDLLSGAVERLGRAAAQGHVEALERLKQLAEHNPEAQYWLGEIYFGGDGVPTNIDTAFYWLKRAAAQFGRASDLLSDWIELFGRVECDDAESQYKLASHYVSNGSPAEALKWLFRSAEKQHPAASKLFPVVIDRVRDAAFHSDHGAQYALGELEVDGQVGKPNWSNAKHWFYRAAKGGHKAAMRRLLEIAQEGDTESQHYLANLYIEESYNADLHSPLEPTSSISKPHKFDNIPSQLVESLRHSARHGDPESKFLLGQLYVFGRRRYSPVGIDFIAQAAEQGHNEALEWIHSQAEMSTCGRSNQAKCAIIHARMRLDLKIDRSLSYELLMIARCDKKALHLLRILAGRGDKWAQWYLGKLRYFLDGFGIDPEDPLATLLKYVESTQGRIENEFIDSKIRITSNENAQKEGIKWFCLAANQGVSAAQYLLGKIYSAGCGVEQDSILAATFVVQAAVQGHKEASQLVESESFSEHFDAGQAAYTMGRILLSEASDSESKSGPALEWLVKAVHLGHNEALLLLRMSAEKGHTDAAYQLARVYLSGKREQGYGSIGVDWIHLAATQGHVEAQYILGNIYAKGLFGLNQDRVKSANYLRQAIDKGHVQSLVLLAQVGDIRAQRRLIKKYLLGKIEALITTPVMYILRKRAAQGNVDAQYVIALIYLKLIYSNSKHHTRQRSLSRVSRGSTPIIEIADEVLLNAVCTISAGQTDYNDVEFLINAVYSGRVHPPEDIGVRLLRCAADLGHTNASVLLVEIDHCRKKVTAYMNANTLYINGYNYLQHYEPPHNVADVGEACDALLQAAMKGHEKSREFLRRLAKSGHVAARLRFFALEETGYSYLDMPEVEYGLS